MELEQIARAIVLSNYHAYVNTLVGTAPQCVHDLTNRYRDIRPGDFVIEITTALMFDRGRSSLDAVGQLLRITQEPADFGDPEFIWNEEEEGCPHPTERCTYIRTFDGREFRWTNASFISIPTEYPMRRVTSYT